MWLADGVPNPAAPEEYLNGGGLERHPLFRWAQVAGAQPQTLRRVPSAVSQARYAQECREVMRPLGAQEQLLLPLTLSGRRH